MFDMAYGDDMIDAGVVDMEVGAAEMAMGDPVGGAEIMALGQIDVDAGQTAIDVGLAGAQMGMMDDPIGRVAMDAALVQEELVVEDQMIMAQEDLMMQQRAQMLRAQFNEQQAIQGAKIMQMRNQEAIIEREQEVERLQWQREKARLQEQAIIQQNTQKEKIREEQMRAQQQKIREEQFRLQEEQVPVQQQQMEQMRLAEERIRQQREQLNHLAKEEHKIQREQVQVERMIVSQNRAKQQLEEVKLKQRIQTEKLQKQIFNQKKLLYFGKLYRLVGVEWEVIEEATITEEAFLDISIESITKLKIKAESKVPGTRMIKITTTTQDFFISVLLEQQAEWMARIIWAKLASLGKSCNVNELFEGSIDGEIIKKGFFGGWDLKIGAVSGSVFKILPGLDSSAEKTITEVPEIWTRFQIVNDNKLIVKMHHHGFKLEVGVPTERAVGWMRGFFQLVK